VFNDSVDAYQTWTLFLIFVSIMVLISGVVLLTLKKPEKRGGTSATPGIPGSARSIRPSRRRSDSKQDLEQGEGAGMEQEGRELDDDQTLWELGEMSDDGDGDDVRSAGGRSEGQRTPRRQPSPEISRKPQPQQHPGEEGRGLMGDEEEDDDDEHLRGRFGKRSTSPVPSVSSNIAVWR